MVNNTAQVQAINLAAGIGSRLGRPDEKAPKCLIEVGGQPLIHYSLSALKAAGIADVAIVTGYRAQMLREFVGYEYLGLSIRYFYNPHYASTGSAVSLKIAAAEVGAKDALVLESDLLFDAAFLKAALSDPRPNLILAADVTGSGDEVYLCAGQDQQISYLGKDATKEVRRASIGELAGITRLSNRFLRHYVRAAQKLALNNGATGHYEDLIFKLSKADNQPVYVRHCPGLAWTEIDTSEDIQRARFKVYPRIKALTSHPSSLYLEPSKRPIDARATTPR